jgi:DNA topoisomerase-1
MRIINSMKLVIVESPSKAKTIEKYLGKDYTVRSSIGHIRDLPKSNKDALDIDGGFIPRYVVSIGKEKVIRELVSLGKKADEILLATDPDREGEAIAWHLEEVLRDHIGNKTPMIQRVTFNEITKNAVISALEKPRKVDIHLKEAQEARRVLDRLVGYDLSGLIWKKVRYGLSAGRVQSPALRILVEREREIRAFIPTAFYPVFGDFSPTGTKSTFQLKCSKIYESFDEAQEAVVLGKKGTWYVHDIKESPTTRKPNPPFRTSTLQQSASTRLGFSPSRTMRAAQKLYEAGHITYMRTDSVALSQDALRSIASFIGERFGSTYVSTVQYATTNKNAQEAHEAIRPTNAYLEHAGSTEDERRLYELIFKRTVGSQMTPARLLRAKLVAKTKENLLPEFTTNGIRLVFDGWLALDTASRGDDVELPQVNINDDLSCIKISFEEKFTTPPNRYSEAGLIKELEQRGIGRPSTYASIITTIIDRGYVEKESKTLVPTTTGEVVSGFLEEHFTRYVGDDFTAMMEDELDEIARGERGYVVTLKEFYDVFKKEVDAKEHIEKVTNLGEAPTEFSCPKCQASMVYKLSKTGTFMSCSRYPDCDGALTEDGKEPGKQESLGIDPETQKNVYVLNGRFGPYVQLGENPVVPKKTIFPKGHKKTPEDKALVAQEKILIEQAKQQPGPKRASLPKGVQPESVTLGMALEYLVLPRTLGSHPETGESIIANVGRFGPYVGHGREFRSIKPRSGYDAYTITLEQALGLLQEAKSLPKGTTLAKDLGKHPKTGKHLQVLQSKSGYYLAKGLRRVYLPQGADIENFSLDDALKLLS